jgi:hypothetical protein
MVDVDVRHDGHGRNNNNNNNNNSNHDGHGRNNNNSNKAVVDVMVMEVMMHCVRKRIRL